MEQSYYLLGMKQMGWVTKTGQYSTDIKTAATFGRTAAFARARAHKANSNILVPVLVEDMDAI